MGYTDEIEKARLATQKNIEQGKPEQKVVDEDNNPEHQAGNTKYSEWANFRNSVHMIQVFNRENRSISIDWSWIPHIYDPSDDKIVILTQTGLKITVTGSALHDLRKRLGEKRITRIRPHKGTIAPPNGEEFIEDIEIEQQDFGEAVLESMKYLASTNISLKS